MASFISNHACQLLNYENIWMRPALFWKARSAESWPLSLVPLYSPSPFMTLGKWGSVYVWVQWGHLYMSFILQLERRPVQCDRVECHHGLYSDNVTPLAGLCTFWYWVASKFSPSQHLLHYFSGYALARLQRSLGTFFTHRGPKNWHFARGQMQNKGLREETSCFNI